MVSVVLRARLGRRRVALLPFRHQDNLCTHDQWRESSYVMTSPSALAHTLGAVLDCARPVVVALDASPGIAVHVLRPDMVPRQT